MPNDERNSKPEIPMTKDTEQANSEASIPRYPQSFGHSSFVILLTFDICHSSFAVHRLSPLASGLYE